MAFVREVDVRKRQDKPDIVDTVYVSSGALGVTDVAGAIARCRAIGITRLELASGLKCPPDQWALVEEATGEISFLLHNYFPAPENSFVLNLAALDDYNLQQSLAMAEKAIELSALVEAPFYSVHAGFAHALVPADLGNPGALRRKVAPDEACRRAAMERYKKSVRHLAKYGEHRGVKLLLENNVVASKSFQEGEHHGMMLVTAEEIVEFFECMQVGNIGLLADVGHARVSAKTLGFDAGNWLNKVMPYVSAFHLSDNDALHDSNQPFDEQAWFFPILSKSQNLPRVVEVYNIDDKEIRQLISIAGA